MSKTYSLGVTNTTASEATIAPVALSLATNYALVKEVAGEVQLKNITSPDDQVEIIKLSCKTVPMVKTMCTNVNPARVKDGVLYQLEIHDLLRETDSDVPGVVDHPGSLRLTFAHDVSAPWTASTALTMSWIKTMLTRALGLIQSDDGTELFDRLAKGALRPVDD